MTSSRARLFAFASVSSLLVLGMIAAGCGASANGTSFSDDEDASGSDDDSGKKADATTSDGGGFGSDSGGGKDSGEKGDAAEEEDASSTIDAGKDASTIVDAGSDAATTVDAGSDAGVDAGSDAGTTVDAGTVDAGTVDAGTVDAGPTATTIVISEIRTRGAAGGNDEFVELYNPTAATITLDNTWKLNSRSAASTTACTSNGTDVWTGSGKTIPSHGHFLVVGADYTAPPAKDETMTGVTDGTSLTLVHGGAVVDAVCLGYDTATTTKLTTGCASHPYVCEGTPVTNPHDNDTDTNDDVSVERKPGGASGNGADTNDNATDFMVSTPANPQNASSPATP